MKRQHIPASEAAVLTHAEAAEYVGLSVAAFDQRVKAGHYPEALPADEAGRGRWSRELLDRAVRRIAGTDEMVNDAAQEALDILEAPNGHHQRAVHSSPP